MKQPWVIRLGLSDACRAEVIGPKAHSLLRLVQAGMRVPEGFCITAQAFQEHVQKTGLSQCMQLEHGREAADTPAEIRQAIAESEMDEELVGQIRRYYERLNGGPVAVRSSATAEDLPGHSFAGQHETFLNILDFPSCLEAIKKCWASLWTDRAFAYRQRNGIERQNIAMAVIVQRQVAAEVAGVMFTADPIRGHTDRIVIEACRGLGEALVSGKVTPDEIIFAKRNLRPIWILPVDLNRPACLNTRMGRRLAKAGRKIERVFGGPQDIEWAVAKGKIYFLQARPMTIQPKEQTWEERQIWTNTNTGEVAPDVITPLSWSILKRFLMPLFGNLFWTLSIDIGAHPLFGLAAGRLYFNFNTGMAFITKLPSFLMKPQKADVLFGGGDKEQYDLRKIHFGPDDLPDLKVSMWKVLWRGPRSLGLLFTRRYSKALKILESMKQNSRHYASISVESMSAARLLGLLAEIFERDFTDLDCLYLAVALAPTPLVVFLCRRWLKDKNRIIANSLLKAAGDMEDVQAGAALANLAGLAEQDAEVCEIVRSGENWKQAREQLERSECGRKFIEAWNVFMSRHGHHCRSEILLYNPRWAERPDYVLQMVKGCLYKPDQDTPGRRYGRQVQNQAGEIDRMAGQLRNPLKQWILRKLVKRAQRGLAFRENTKSEMVRLLFRVRQIILALGRRMQAERILAEADDIFFLEFGELEGVIGEKADFDVTQTIRQRRVEYERFKAMDPPQVIIGKFDPDSYVPAKINTGVTAFQGMSACPGKVTGRARVILRTDEHQQVLPGEILVAPFTDPGWTPYFINAAGIIMDQGGLLSHGSIVAREYGIPAVVNVGPATKIIQTGQMLFLDADQGKVTILPQL